MKVIYIGATDHQVRWGSHDDPRNCLVEGEAYELDHAEVHSWHTKYHLTKFPGKEFNSVSFRSFKEEDDNISKQEKRA